MTETRIAAYDGTELYLRVDLPCIARASIVLVHGLCEHQGRYGYFTARLQAAGYQVYRFDHRGHGRSDGTRAFYDDSTQITEDVRRIVTIAREESGGNPVYLFGHSMGGYAVALFGARHPDLVDGIITSGALVTNNAGLGVDLAPDTSPETTIDNALGGAVCRDPAVARAYAADPHVGKTYTAGLFFSLFQGIRWMDTNLHRFTAPALILHGVADSIVHEKDSRDLFERISSQDKTLILFAKLYHEILNEPEKDAVIAEILDWLDARVRKTEQ